MWFVFVGVGLVLTIIGGLYARRRLATSLATLGVSPRAIRVMRWLSAWLLFGFPALRIVSAFVSAKLGREAMPRFEGMAAAWLLAVPFVWALLVLVQSLPWLLVGEIVRFALRQKTRLGALRVHDEVLLLQSLLWDDEVRVANFPALDAPPRVSAKELEMSMALVKSFESDFDPSKFSDDYQAELRTLIDAKLKQGAALDTDATFGEVEGEKSGDVLDLMEALKRSVDKSRAGKKAPAAVKKATVASRKPARKKASA